MSRIALDLRMVGAAMHGIARYAFELARRLPELAPEHEFVVLAGPEGLPERVHPKVREVRCCFPFLHPLEQIDLPFALEQLRPDLVHWTSFSVAGLSARPCIVTLHDANHLAYPENYGALRSLYYRGLVLPVARRARKVITVSRFAAEELERHLGLPETAVVYNGVDPRFRPATKQTRKAIRSVLGLPERFVLYVGNAKPHKNLATLVAATAEAEVPLVAVVPRRIPGLPAHVRCLDGLRDEQLPALYSTASAFAFPSLYEGFGLPPLEAMACGTPTLVSACASLPEVVGDAAVLLPPRDVHAWASAIRSAIDAPVDAKAVARMRARAAQFSWDRAAEQTLEIYRAALGEQLARSVPRVA